MTVSRPVAAVPSRRASTTRTVGAALPALALAALATVLGGCAAKGATLGDEIGAAGAEYSQLGERWEDGQAMVKQGRKLRSRGRERVSDGEDDVERGEALIREGQLQMDRSRADYNRLKNRSPASVGPAPGS